MPDLRIHEYASLLVVVSVFGFGGFKVWERGVGGFLVSPANVGAIADSVFAGDLRDHLVKG